MKATATVNITKKTLHMIIQVEQQLQLSISIYGTLRTENDKKITRR